MCCRVPLLQSLIGLFELPEDESTPDDEHFIEIEDTPGVLYIYDWRSNFTLTIGHFILALLLKTGGCTKTITFVIGFTPGG